MSRLSGMMRGSTALLVLSVAFWACGGRTGPLDDIDDGSGGVGGTGGTAGTSGIGGSPYGGSGGETGGTGGGPGGTGGGPGGTGGTAGEGGGPVVRTISFRDPHEGIDTPGNLLLDGGFEFSGDLSYAWSSISYSPLLFGHGAMCRSGMRCGLLDNGGGMYAIVVSPDYGTNMKVKLHMKTMHLISSCKGLNLYVLDAYDYSGGGSLVYQESAELDADGWCEWKGWASPVPNTFPVFYVEASGARILIDDVVVSLPENGEKPPNTLKQQVPLTYQQRQQLKKVAAAARADITRSRPRPKTVHDLAPPKVRIAPWIR